MKKTLMTLLALAFAFAFGAANAMKHEMPKGDAPKAEAKKDDPVAKACKDMKPGTMVKVDGKDMKCPEPKKDVKKKEVKKKEAKKEEKKGATPATPAKPAAPAKKDDKAKK